jgi:hypothetical protein
MPGDISPPIFRSEEELAKLSASERIRYRLIGAERRYHANDNIAPSSAKASSMSCVTRCAPRCRRC